MYDATERYNQRYVDMIEAKAWRAPAITRAAKVIYNFFKPSSVVDWGAANGFYLQALRNLGVKTILGIEGTEFWLKPMARRIGHKNVLIRDIRKDFELPNKFDLCISIEVLEHIESSYADVAAKNLTKLSDTLLITASPHQGGFHHENPQPKSYWINIFKDLRFFEDLDSTMILVERFRPVGIRWLVEDMMVLRRH